jgi:hypothetical protein
MSLDAKTLFALLPAVYRIRDAANGNELQALFDVIARQAAIVEENIEQLYDDQFIETCANWVIPYIGDLIGYHSIYQTSASVDSRVEVANTIGYRRRKGTHIALQQVATDVSGRAAVVVEEFRRLIVAESMRHPRPHHVATLDLRRTRAPRRLGTAFDMSARTIDVRRIAPRARTASTPDAAPLEIALHGPGRFNVPDIALYLWRWKSWAVTAASAFAVDARRFRFSPLGLDMPLFAQPPSGGLPFSHLNTRLDVPQPITREEFAAHLTDFYGPSLMLFAGGVPVEPKCIRCANLADRPNGAWCVVPDGCIAIDPELGRIQFAADLSPPQSLRANYCYGFPAAIGGGPYERSASFAYLAASQPDFFAIVGTSDFPSIEAAVAQWNALPPGHHGVIVLPGYERYAIDLSGPNAIQLAHGSSLTLAAAKPVSSGDPHKVDWNDACVTLEGDIEVVDGTAAPEDDAAAPGGRLTLSGAWLSGQLRIGAAAATVQIFDTTFVPGLGAASPGLSAGEASVVIGSAETSVCMLRCISGPIYAHGAASVRLCASIIDATSPCCVAYAGADGYSEGADLHVEDCTIVGKLRTRTMRLASNTLFIARCARHDPWPAAVWCSRRQAGCVRFCFLPFDSITPRRYECLPPDAGTEAALRPSFITLRYGDPSYALLSGDVPMAVWTGADNGSQMGVYYQIEETQALGNVQIRTPEYLPVTLESGLFLNPSRPLPRPRAPPLGYGVHAVTCCGDDVDEPLDFVGIGVSLL